MNLTTDTLTRKNFFAFSDTFYLHWLDGGLFIGDYYYYQIVYNLSNPHTIQFPSGQYSTEFTDRFAYPSGVKIRTPVYHTDDGTMHEMILLGDTLEVRRYKEFFKLNYDVKGVATPFNKLLEDDRSVNSTPKGRAG